MLTVRLEPQFFDIWQQLVWNILFSFSSSIIRFLSLSTILPFPLFFPFSFCNLSYFSYSTLNLYTHTTTTMSSFRDKVKYSRANSDQDSSENLLSDEERHVRQPEPETCRTFWQRVLRLLPYILGTLLACFFAGLAGFFMRHDLDGVCASHTSQHCE